MACDELPNERPYWTYEDIGVFFLVVVFIGFTLRLLARFHLLARSELSNPSVLLQSLLVASLSWALYLVLKLRHHRPVLHSLGWVWPPTVHMIVSLIAGVLLASGVAFYLRYCHRSTPRVGLLELLFLDVSLGPILEESFFRGCLLPLIAQTTDRALRPSRSAAASGCRKGSRIHEGRIQKAMTAWGAEIAAPKKSK